MSYCKLINKNNRLLRNEDYKSIREHRYYMFMNAFVSSIANDIKSIKLIDDNVVYTIYTSPIFGTPNKNEILQKIYSAIEKYHYDIHSIFPHKALSVIPKRNSKFQKHIKEYTSICNELRVASDGSQLQIGSIGSIVSISWYKDENGEYKENFPIIMKRLEEFNYQNYEI